MDQNTLTQLGDELHRALLERRTVAPLTSRGLDLTIEDAYRIQERMVSHRRKAGERVVGKKIGVTSKVVMQMLDVHQPDFGWLLGEPLRDLLRRVRLLPGHEADHVDVGGGRCGHWTQLEHAGRFNRLVEDFLAEE